LRYRVDRTAAAFQALDELEIMVLGVRRAVGYAPWRGPSYAALAMIWC